jgi:hypothetical protein
VGITIECGGEGPGVHFALRTVPAGPFPILTLLGDLPWADKVVHVYACV